MDYFHGETPNSGLLLIGSDGILYSPNDYGADWKVFKDGKWHGKDQVEKATPLFFQEMEGETTE